MIRYATIVVLADESKIIMHSSNLQNQNGFQLISSSYVSGRISCTFTRSILADNLNEDRNLNESAYLLLAIGAQNGKATAQ